MPSLGATRGADGAWIAGRLWRSLVLAPSSDQSHDHMAQVGSSSQSLQQSDQSGALEMSNCHELLVSCGMFKCSRILLFIGVQRSPSQYLGGYIHTESGQTLQGSSSAVSKPPKKMSFFREGEGSEPAPDPFPPAVPLNHHSSYAYRAAASSHVHSSHDKD